MSVRKRFDAQVVVPCPHAMKMAVRRIAEQFNVSDAEVARLCIEHALPAVHRQLAADRERRSTSLRTSESDRALAG